MNRPESHTSICQSCAQTFWPQALSLCEISLQSFVSHKVYFRHYSVGWGESHFVDTEVLPWCSELKTMNGWCNHLFTCSFLYSQLESQVISKNVYSGVQTFWAPYQRREPRKWPRRNHRGSKNSNKRWKPGGKLQKLWESFKGQKQRRVSLMLRDK